MRQPHANSVARGASTARIEKDDDGVRLDRWFRRHYPALAHGRLEKMLRTGEIRLDGKRAKAGERIAAGQLLRLPPQVAGTETKERSASPAARQPSSELRGLILHMDDSVIVLNKPSGLATQGGSGLTKHVDGMLDALAFDRKQRPRLVHRLDRDTSGVLVVARTVPAAAALSKSLQQRDAKKIYWALTRGVPKTPRGTVKLPLAKKSGFGPRGRDERMTNAAKGDEGARHALTDFAVLGRAGDEFAWLAAKPVTGRTHQIRVHLASLGTPIVGDFKYGGVQSRGRGAIEDQLHLHARTIDIAHPDGGRLTVSAPLPPHMLKSWTLLGFDPEAREDPFPTRRKR